MFTLPTNHACVTYIQPEFSQQMRADNNFRFASYDPRTGEVYVEGQSIWEVSHNTSQKAQQSQLALVLRDVKAGLDVYAFTQFGTKRILPNEVAS